jgi:hypothetical protein
MGNPCLVYTLGMTELRRVFVCTVLANPSYVPVQWLCLYACVLLYL